jgi:acetyl-CoA carboxylase biotin carboxyl carrier protein
MDTEQLRSLIELMNQNDLLELEIVEAGGSRVRLKKMFEGGQRIVQVPMHAGTMPMTTAAAGAPSGTASAPAADAVPSNRKFVKSPMVGTFYRSADPESPAYVNTGDVVGHETVVCILEAMKVFNEIKAECEGKIVSVLVENGQAVEYGQPLFAVDPA